MTIADDDPFRAVGDTSHLTDDERCTFSILGAIRFDASAVAEALRSRPLTMLERHGLANLLEGKRPDGLKLMIAGQGKNWHPWFESSQRYDQAIAMAAMMDAEMANGASWEEATLATADRFSVSESTVSRRVGIGRILANEQQDAEK